MAAKVVKVVKLQIPAGKANPAPPVGPALGQAQLIFRNLLNSLTTERKIKSVILFQ